MQEGKQEVKRLMSKLELKEITMQFGGVVAIDHLNLQVNEGEIVALIGPNGAGKTTVFNVVTGVYKPTSGKVHVDNRDATALRTDKVTRKGLARTFQNIRLFKGLTVLENVLIAEHMHYKSNILSMATRMPWAVKEDKQMHEEAMKLLELVGLDHACNEIASSLPYGQQRRLEIARALATRPSVLLLDEPAAGMNPQETVELTTFIRDLRNNFKLTIFIIEHHMDLIMEISDRIYVLDFGKLIAEGTPAEIQENEQVIQAYLGVSEDVEYQEFES